VKGQACPFCGAACKPEGEFCPACGSRLGAPVVGRAKPRLREEPLEPPVGLRPLCWLLEYFPGLASPKVIILTAIIFVMAAAFAGAALFMVVLGAVIIAFLSGGFAILLYWTGLAWILSGEVSMPWDALADFNGTHWMLFATLTLLPVAAVFGWIKAHGF